MDKQLVHDLIEALEETIYRERGWRPQDRCMSCYCLKGDPHFEDCKYGALLKRLADLTT